MKTNLKTWMISNFILLLTIAAIGQPTTPFLTLNTEMHTAGIVRIDSDKAGKTLLTVSDDKTAKLWNAQTGELIRTLRVPIGENQEGRLYAGAISPDGKIVAVGGWTAYEWDNTICIYLFDAHTGSMLHRISGLPNVILDIEFSPNGKYMVATLGEGGIRIYEIPTNFNQLPESLKLSGSFTDYSADSYNAAFDHTGRLATVCYDGKLRLYSPLSRGEGGFKLKKTRKTTAGKRPFSLAFSPDGALLAVGYNDSPTIEVRDGKTLKVLYEPNITDVKNANSDVNKVSFSACGNYLIAGGSYRKYVNNGWWHQIRVYTNKGRASYTDYPAADNTIMDIKPIQGGNLIFAGGQTDFGRFTINGSKVFYKNAEINAYNANDKSHFKINNAGTAIGVTPYGK